MFSKSQDVPPAELEEIIKIRFKIIVDVAVIGIPNSKEATEYTTAFIVLKQSLSESESLKLKKEIENRVAQEVADHKKLRGGVEIIDEIPRNNSGKIQRFLLIDKIMKKRPKVALQ